MPLVNETWLVRNDLSNWSVWHGHGRWKRFAYTLPAWLSDAVCHACKGMATNGGGVNLIVMPQWLQAEITKAGG